MSKNNKILIGIIDSGIDINFLNEFNVLPAKSASFEINFEKKLFQTKVFDEDDFEKWSNGKTNIDLFDSNSHGTSVTSIIHNNISDTSKIQFSFAKILNETNLTSAYCLVESLKWMVEEVNPEFINLSLGGNLDKQKDSLTEILRKAKEKNIKIFCSATGLKTYPAESPFVTTIGDKGLTKYRKEETKVDHYIDDEVVDIYESGIWKKVNMVTSFACPLFLARYINENIL